MSVADKPININVNLTNDALGFGKGVVKLLDVIQKGTGLVYEQTIGTILEPRRIKAISAAEAEAKHFKIISNTQTLLQADELAQRTGKRLFIKELRRQDSIETVISLTATQLDDNVSDKPVDPDWATRFFDRVQDITDEEIQKLWSKILAGEIKKPGSFSIRTLEILRNISKEEADVFTNCVCPLVSSGQLIIKFDNKSELTEFNLTYGKILTMREAGLIMDGDQIIYKFKGDINAKLALIFNNKALLLKFTKDLVSVPVLYLSAAGRELYAIQQFNINYDYIAKVKESLNPLGLIDSKLSDNPKE